MTPMTFLAFALVVISVLGFIGIITAVLIKAEKRREKKRKSKKSGIIPLVGEGTSETDDASEEEDETDPSTTETSTETSTGTPTDPSTGTPTDPSTGTPTDPSTGTPTDPSTGPSTETTGPGTTTTYVGAVYSGDLDAVRVILEPLHPDIPIRHNVQKVYNVKVVGSPPESDLTLTFNSEKTKFAIPRKTRHYEEGEDGEEGQWVYNGWPSGQSMAGGALNQSGPWEDNNFDGGIYRTHDGDYMCDEPCNVEGHTYSPDNEWVSDFQALAKNFCTESSTNFATYYNLGEKCNEYAGSLTLAWNSSGENAYPIGEASFGTTKTVFTIWVDGFEYETFNVRESESEFLEELKGSEVDSNILTHHYRISHDPLMKAGNLMDVLNSLNNDPLNIRVVFHEFSCDPAIMDIAILVTQYKQGIPDLVILESDPNIGKYSSLAASIYYYLVSLTDKKEGVNKILAGEKDLDLLSDTDLSITQQIRNSITTYALKVVFTGFDVYLDTAKEATSQDQAFKDLQSTFNTMLTDGFLRYVERLYETSIKKWTGEDIAVRVVGVHTHESHGELVFSGVTTTTFTQHTEPLQDQEGTKACSFFSTEKLVFRDLQSFPSASPNKTLEGCDEPWHLVLHIREMSTAAAHVSDIFYSDIAILEEYLDQLVEEEPNAAVEIKNFTTLTHEIGHTFGFHDVYAYPDRVPDEWGSNLDSDICIMHSAEDLTATDRALFSLMKKIRNVQ